MVGSVLTFLLVGLVAVLALSLVLGLIGLVFAIGLAVASFLLFKVAPLVLLGYVLVRFLAPRRNRISRADRRWLEGD